MLYKRIKNFLVLLLLIVSFQSIAASKIELNWYDNFIFQDSGFVYQLIRSLGYTYEKGADIGECIATARKIKEGDFESWYANWLSTATRIEKLAQNSSPNSVSARQAYLRASNYYRTAGFFMVDQKDRDKSIEAYQKSKNDFLHAIKNIDYIETVAIPYENVKLPGYLIHSKNKNAPIVIVNTGFDGTAEELYFEVGQALHERGYNVLLVEGPGQGSVLRQLNLPFRPDWEKVIKPIVDYVETLPDINKNKIALMGISMGGYLAPRATAFEPRIKALIANGGVYDFYLTAANQLPPELLSLIDTNPNEFNKILNAEMEKNTMARWFYQNGMWTFHANTPAEFMKKLRNYNLKNIAEKIKIPTLIVESVDDNFMKGQSEMLYSKITSKKTYLKFTREEAAQNHCQVSATGISNEKILNWLDMQFI